VLTSDNPRREDPLAIMAEVASGVADHPGLELEPDRAHAIELALDRAEEQDWLVIAGKGHESSQWIAGRELPFSDVAIVQRSRKLTRSS
jgi:UDP-N-acetylmuramoyl-L-alanyl-D-glutamate--2,6-diaminopimelate ligase